jgi:BMFP domain-containing protein YqiC
VSAAEWKDLVQRLEALEARLGQAARPPSMAYNIERRITDLEKRLQQVEQQQTQLQKWESRLRRLEMK